MMKKSKEFIDQQISASRLLLQNQYAYLNDTGGFDAAVSGQKTTVTSKNIQNSKYNAKNPYTYIEQEARKLQLIIWEKQYDLWPNGVPLDPVDLLDPRIAAQCLGFEYDTPEYIGEFCNHGNTSDIAGAIDRSAKRISISQRLPYNTLRFTAAHELGHAVLHTQTMLHRDRPIDGSNKTGKSREPIEIEADKFAAYFLMPEKLVRTRFEQIFGVKVFKLNDDTAFALEETDSDKLISQCKTPRDLARILSKAERYNARHLISLAQQFHVSNEAMAIRIEELKLIDI